MANEFGMEKVIDQNDKSGEIFLNKEFTTNSTIIKYVEDFENATFWEELIERLARRDFIRKYGKEAIVKMPLSERFEKEMSVHKAYHEEFGTNGLENLEIHNWREN